MTIEHYRLMVALRWSDLESLKVKDIPLKIHLQRLRKRQQRDECCAVYDPPSGNEPSGNGSERYHRFTERKTSHIFGDDDDVSIIVCRKASSSLRRSAGEFATVTSVEPMDIDSPYVSEVDEPPAEEAPKVRGRSPLSDGRATSFGTRNSGKLPRGVKRAAKNNEYIRKRVSQFRKTLAKHHRILRFDPGCDREAVLATIRGIEAHIARLRGEMSESLSPPRASRPGWEYAPPPNLDSHVRCRQCDVCPCCVHCNQSTDPLGTRCTRCDELHVRYSFESRPSNVRTESSRASPFEHRGPSPGPRLGERKIPRRAGGKTVLFCGMCNVPLSKAYCTNPNCAYWQRRSRDSNS